jgi:hypothetical protein
VVPGGELGPQQFVFADMVVVQDAEELAGVRGHGPGPAGVKPAAGQGA